MRRLIIYVCGRCRVAVNVEKGESCNCRTQDDKKVSTEFKPFFSEETQTYITSTRQMERVYKKHGLRAMGDNPHRKKYEEIVKNKEDYLQQRYKKEMGVDYKPGSDVRWSDKRNELVPRRVWEYEKATGRD